MSAFQKMKVGMLSKLSILQQTGKYYEASEKLMASCCQRTNYGTYIGTGIFCPWSCGSLIKVEDDTLNVKIDIPCHNPVEGVYQTLLKQVTHLEHFPEESTSYILQLVYLSSLTGLKSPYTKSEKLTFKISAVADRHTRRWLQCGLIGGITLIATGCMLGLKAISDWKEGQDSGVTATGSFFCGISGVIASWISTGSNPDFASNAANERQDKLRQYEDRSQKIAVALIDLYESHQQFAKYITNKISLSDLQKAMLRDDPKAENVNTLALETAMAYVKGEKMPENAPLLIRTWIEIKKQKGERKSL